MLFRIDFNAATALYRQLVDQVCYAAAAGTLQPRDPLPTIRPLARQLHLNRNTVAKAYSELESLGVIKTIPGKGCFLEAVNTPFTQKVRDKLLTAKIDAALVTAHQLQVNPLAFSARVAERIRFFLAQNADTQRSITEEVKAKETVTPSARTRKTTSAAALPSSTPSASASETNSATDSGGWSPFTD